MKRSRDIISLVVIALIGLAGKYLDSKLDSQRRLEQQNFRYIAWLHSQGEAPTAPDTIWETKP